MEIHEALEQLSNPIKNEEWFCDAVADGPTKLIVYTKWQTGDIIKQIPEYIDKFHVLVHFKPRSVSNTSQPVIPKIHEEISVKNDVQSEDNDMNINDLIKELDRLEGICGVHTLADIFFETHDKHNAVTNMSARYPEVRESMDKLYDKYGFDVIYEELEL